MSVSTIGLFPNMQKDKVRLKQPVITAKKLNRWRRWTPVFRSAATVLFCKWRGIFHL